MSRYRQRFEYGSSGTVTFKNVGVPGSYTVTPTRKDEAVTDEVQKGNGHEFHVQRFDFVTAEPRFNGQTQGTTSEATIALNYPVGRVSDAYYAMSHIYPGGEPSLAAAATELVSKTNPSRPHFDIGVFAGELKDLPNLLFKRSEDLGRDISKGRLSAEFGWKPFINDLLSLLKVQEAFTARVRELDHLQRTGIRRKRKIWSGSSQPYTVFEGLLESLLGMAAEGRIVNVTTAEVWGFVKWMPENDIYTKLGLWNTSKESRALLAILGITPTIADLSTVWELLPFSWLADWCTNAGDYIASHRNSVGAHPTKIQIMRRFRTESTATITSVSNGFSITPMHSVRRRENLYRHPIANLSVDAHLPFLNERKVAILADVVHGIFKRSKVDGRKDAKTTWNWEQSDYSAGFPSSKM